MSKGFRWNFEADFKPSTQPLEKNNGSNDKSREHAEYDQCLDDVSNAIHPIFAKQNLARLNYEKLLPALRLASLLIDTDCLLDFWHAIFFGVNGIVQHGDGPADWHIAYFRQYATLSAEERAMARARLHGLAYMVRFQRRKGSDMNGWGALTEEDGPFIGQEIGSGTRYVIGTRAVISLNETWYDSLCSGSKLSREAQLIQRFEVATLLVHEVVHAACISMLGPNSAPIPFEHNTIAEEGLEWEAFVFGGCLRREGRASFTTVTEWPHPALTAKHYTGKGVEFWILGQQTIDIESRWTVPIEYIEKLFQTSFWKETVPKMGAEAIKIPREHGQIYHLRSDGSERVFFAYDPNTSAYTLPEHVEHVGYGQIRTGVLDLESEALGCLKRMI